MARGWSFVGGLMIVTTITYLNINTIQVVAQDIQNSVIRERKKLEDARNQSPTTSTTRREFGKVIVWPTPTRVVDRIKQMWNEDIERTVRRMQKTDWERMGKAVEQHMKRAKERMVSSLGRVEEESKKRVEDSKKNST